MRILMLGNSFTFTNDMPQMLAGLTGAEVTSYTRGGARLAEHLNVYTEMGARTQASLKQEHWDYVVLQEMSNAPITAPERFFSSVERLCRQIHAGGGIPILYATWAYRKGGPTLAAKGWDYDDMARRLSDAYHTAAERNQALIADVGQRFYALSPAADLYADDGIHPSEQGSRLAAETIAEVIARHRRKQA